MIQEVKQKLEEIKEKKETQLNDLELGSIHYSVLNEEIDDARFALEALDIEDAIERTSKLHATYKSTTSSSIYDVLGSAFFSSEHITEEEAERRRQEAEAQV